jgi:polar amino acid transport system substrate-binding protein
LSFLQTCETVDVILKAPWFSVVDSVGTFAFAFYGALRAVRLKAPIGGVVLLAAFPAVGGGLMRDLILCRHPVAFLTTPLYGFIILLAVYFVRFIDRKTNNPSLFEESFWMRWVFPAMDALGLAAFTVLGIAVSSLKGLCPLWVWGPFFGCLTSCGGGILSGLLMEGSAFLVRPNQDLRVAVPGSILLSGLFCYFNTSGTSVSVNLIVALGMIGIFASRFFIFLMKR